MYTGWPQLITSHLQQRGLRLITYTLPLAFILTQYHTHLQLDKCTKTVFGSLCSKPLRARWEANSNRGSRRAVKNWINPPPFLVGAKKNPYYNRNQLWPLPYCCECKWSFSWDRFVKMKHVFPTIWDSLVNTKRIFPTKLYSISTSNHSCRSA